jgi:hypothetical protein
LSPIGKEGTVCLVVPSLPKGDNVVISFNVSLESFREDCQHHGEARQPKASGKLSQVLGSPKDVVVDQKAKSGIYEIQCQTCPAIYYGQTRRSIEKRFKVQRANVSVLVISLVLYFSFSDCTQYINHVILPF